MSETTTAAVCIDDMLTAAVLLAIDAVDEVTGYGQGQSKWVRLEAVPRVSAEEMERLLGLCKRGHFGIMVDAGKMQDAFRQVSRIVDMARRA